MANRENMPPALASLELPPGVEPRDYQLQAVEAALSDLRAGHRSLVVMPTGTGKTVVAVSISQIVHREDGRPTLFLAHTDPLIQQAAAGYADWGALTAIEMANQKEAEFRATVGDPDVVVGTVQTLQGHRLKSKPKDRFGLIIVDEAHHAKAPSYKAILDHFGGHAWILGLTATPDGGAAKQLLGDVFPKLSFHYKIRDAIQDEVLVPIRVRRVPVKVDLRQMSMRGGDYTVSEIEARITPIVEQLAVNIKENIGSRKTVVFCPCVGSASAMSSMLRQVGVKSKYVAGAGGAFGMPRPERRKILEEFRTPAIQVIVCCDLLTEGYDHPEISCIVVARPTRKRYKYVQMIGRGTRRCDRANKQDLLVLDLDWQTDNTTRDLCIPVMLFSEETDVPSYKQFQAGVREATENGDDVDIFAELKKAERRAMLREVRVSYTGKFGHKFAMVEHDPIGVMKILDLKVKKYFDFGERGGGPITDRQKWLLGTLGVKNADGMSKWGASKLIERLNRRSKTGMASFQQVQKLLAKGVEEEQARTLSRQDAARVIAEQGLRGAENLKQMEMFS